MCTEFTINDGLWATRPREDQNAVAIAFLHISEDYILRMLLSSSLGMVPCLNSV